MAHKNEQLLRKQDEAFNKGDIEGMFSLFADDVVAHLGGKNPMAGDVKGRDQLMDTFNKFMAVMGDNIQFETHDILANDTHGIVLQRFTGTKGGQRETISGIMICHFTGDKISEAWFVDLDSYTADAFYAKK